MSKVIFVKKDEEKQECYFDMKDLEDLFEDALLINQYSIECRDDGSAVLEFFDKDNNKIFPSKV